MIIYLAPVLKTLWAGYLLVYFYQEGGLLTYIRMMAPVVEYLNRMSR